MTDLRSSDVVTAGAVGRGSRQFIANSTPAFKTLELAPTQAVPSWLLRSPGILSRRVPGGFLPPGRQLLDQPSRQMRNPSHQLNDQNWSKGHARSESTAAAASRARLPTTS